MEVLRYDITHLDLSMNDIRNFEFLRGFKNLQSLIVDGNIHMDQESLPPLDTLELFFANKCDIEFPRSFIYRVSVVFPSLKYLSMITYPHMEQSHVELKWEGKQHRMRMFAIFMNPLLIHFNDKKITDDDRRHSNEFHKYLGPIDCKLSNFKSLPDTDDIRKILPVHIRDKALDVIEMEAQEDIDDLDEALSSVSVSSYFASHHDDDISIRSFGSFDKASSSPSSVNTITTDEGLGSLAPSEHSID